MPLYAGMTVNGRLVISDQTADWDQDGNARAQASGSNAVVRTAMPGRDGDDLVFAGLTRRF
jgi:hypothetical protein